MKLRTAVTPIAIAIVLALAAAAAAWAVAERAPSPQAAAKQPTPALTVTAVAPREATWPVTIEASGAVAPWQEASIGTQIGGYRLTDVRVNVGDQVKKGQVLARIDPALLQADEAQLQASYDQADANRQRALALRTRGGISEQDVLQFVTQAKTAAAALAAKQLQLRYTEVTAPDDGAISARTATLGAVVGVGQELFRLIRENRLEWRGELTAQQFAHVAHGQQVTLVLPDGSSAKATVRQLAPTLDPQTRLGIVYADLEAGGPARAGMYANGRITLQASHALVLPAECVVIRDGRSYVAKLADGAMPSVALLPVTTGRRDARDVEILDGLAAADRVVAQGAGFLNDGDVVRLAAAPAAQGGAP